MVNLKIITASNRPGRRGIHVSNWIVELAKSNPDFQVEHLDLAEINLPFMDEPHHPRLQNYTKQHTKDWSKKIAEADAFIMVTPEYNYGFTAPLKNAIDFLHREWIYKAVGIVSYGGLSAGTRAAQMLKQVLTTLKMVPLTEAVSISFFESHIKDNIFQPTDALINSAQTMFAEILKMEKALRQIRDKE